MNEDKEAAINHGDEEDCGNWIGVVAELSEKNRKDRQKRILEWDILAGPPHAEIMLGDDPQYTDRIGFWRVRGGLIRIRVSKKGDFDPAERSDITCKEIKAIIDAFKHPVIKKK